MSPFSSWWAVNLYPDSGISRHSAWCWWSGKFSSWFLVVWFLLQLLMPPWFCVFPLTVFVFNSVLWLSNPSVLYQHWNNRIVTFWILIWTARPTQKNSKQAISLAHGKQVTCLLQEWWNLSTSRKRNEIFGREPRLSRCNNKTNGSPIFKKEQLTKKEKEIIDKADEFGWVTSSYNRNVKVFMKNDDNTFKSVVVKSKKKRWGFTRAGR